MAAAVDQSPAETIRQVNRCLAADMTPGMFVTLLYFVLDTSKREVRLIRAGHNPPLLYRASQRRIVPLNPRGIALGLDQKGSLFQSELEVQRFTMLEGDVLEWYSESSGRWKICPWYECEDPPPPLQNGGVVRCLQVPITVDIEAPRLHARDSRSRLPPGSGRQG